MTKEVIEKYIKFAIENGLDLHQWVSEREGFDKWTKDFRISINFKGFALISNINDDFLFGINLVEFITSKEFIEAVARGLKNNGTQTEDLKTIIDGITITQAIAIRENSVDGVSLEEFILELIK